MSEVTTADTASVGQQMERVLEGKSAALPFLNGTRAVTRILDRTYLSMAYLCGGMFLMLALFITYQVIARKFDIIMAPGMDLMSGYTMAMASTWAFSYALRTGSHVRIDVLFRSCLPEFGGGPTKQLSSQSHSSWELPRGKHGKWL